MSRIRGDGRPGLQTDAGAAADDEVVAERGAWDAHAAGQRPGSAGEPLLPPPVSLSATPGAGLITLEWSTVAGAAGYLVHRGPAGGGPLEPVNHGGDDVLAVPTTTYGVAADGDGAFRYAVAAVAAADAPPGPLSAAVLAAPEPSPASGSPPPVVRLTLPAGASGTALPRPWRPIIGSEHLSLLRRGRGPGGLAVGEDFAAALRLAHLELGVEAVRAHGILLDELGVYREEAGRPHFDFAGIDEVYDRLTGLGLRPVVELSFMPHDLAADPSATVFDYRAIISPPRDWSRWGELIERLARHLVERYGRDEVRRWAFEVWNEPNLGVFWSGSKDDYFRLYDETAAALRRADPGLRVGGPATAAAGWIGDFLDHLDASGAPADFVSSHTYGSPPLDLHAIAARHGRPDIDVLWTEWGVGAGLFKPVHDLVFGAPFILRGMRQAMLRGDALAYWVISDQFEEQGEPASLFHGGFGLLTIGNLRKPRYWALALLERLQAEELPVELTGDGAGSLVEAIATRGPDGALAVLVWNGTLDHSRIEGDQALARRIELRFKGLPARPFTIRHSRVDETHSNIRQVWREIGSPDWPDEAAWARLHEADRLAELAPARPVVPQAGSLELMFELPMPGVSFVELLPG